MTSQNLFYLSTRFISQAKKFCKYFVTDKAEAHRYEFQRLPLDLHPLKRRVQAHLTILLLSSLDQALYLSFENSTLLSGIPQIYSLGYNDNMCSLEMYNLSKGSFLLGRALLSHQPLPVMHAGSISLLSCHKLTCPQISLA